MLLINKLFFLLFFGVVYGLVIEPNEFLISTRLPHHIVFTCGERRNGTLNRPMFFVSSFRMKRLLMCMCVCVCERERERENETVNCK